MSATGEPPRPDGGREAGTTLVEALVTMTILAAIGAIAFPVLRQGAASAAFGQATALTEDQLTVSFAPVYAGKMKMLNARSVAVLQGELDKLKPGVRLLLREGESDGDVADLVGLFKDKLTIT